MNFDIEQEAVVQPSIHKQFHLYCVELSVVSEKVQALHVFNVVEHDQFVGVTDTLSLKHLIGIAALRVVVSLGLIRLLVNHIEYALELTSFSEEDQ